MVEASNSSDHRGSNETASRWTPLAAQGVGPPPYLVRTRAPSSRERLAGLLFPEADDPLGRCAGRSRRSAGSLGEDAELGATRSPDARPGNVRRRRGAQPGLLVGGDRAARPRPRAPRRARLSLEPRASRCGSRASAVTWPARRAPSCTRPRSRCSRGATRRRGAITPRSSFASTRTRRTRTSCWCAASRGGRSRRCATRQVRRARSSSSASWASSRPPRFAAAVAAVSRARRRVLRPSLRARRSRPGRRPSPPARSRPASSACGRRRRGPRDRRPRAPRRGAGGAGRRARPLRPRQRRGRRGGAARRHGARRAARPDDIAATGWREISWVQFLRADYERAEESLTRTASSPAGATRSWRGST